MIHAIKSRRKRCCDGFFCYPSFLVFSKAASTACSAAARKPPRSSASTPAIVLPPGEQTASLSAAGCLPVCSTICAAPSVLAQYGLLAGRRATCYPGFEDRCTGAQMVDADVVTDGQITTGRALGAAIPFALELVRLLTDEQTAARTAEEIVYRA